MNETKREKTVRYFSEQIEQYKARARELTADDRADEAVFARVQGNMYDAFAAVFSAAVKTHGRDDEKVVQFFREKLRQIPRNWHKALENARTHGEMEKAHLGSLKLDAVSEIQRTFEEIWEVRI